ncbi:MAG: MMPL family transporter [Actinomycetota bacterium]|nr:MMPL family transporter [Actinomycetota bacterium]
MQTLARLAIQKRWYVIAGWIVFIVGAQLLAGAAGGATYKDVFTLPHTETQKVLDLLQANGETGQTGQAGTVVVHAKDGALDARQAPDGLASALDRLCAGGYHVATFSSPWRSADCAKPSTGLESGTPTLLSKDGKTGLITITWQGNENDLKNFTGVYDRLNHPSTASVQHASAAPVQYEFTGPAFGNLAAQQKGIPPEVFGFIAALLILGLVFRTVGAALTPLISAAAALGSGLALLSLLSHAMNVATFATQLAELMVIGVGVDYALFIVTRHRRNLLRGMPVAESIALSINTSGRAVLFAGATVCVAMLGLCALGVSFLYGVAVGTAIAVALTMIASLTLLPAVLSLLGYRVLPGKTRKAIKAGTYAYDEHKTRWASWSEFVSRNKLVLGAIASAIIVILAIPFFSMRLGHADESTDPAGSTTRKGYDLITDAFGRGYNSTLELVLSGPTAAQPGYLKSVSGDLASQSGVDASSVHATPIGKNLAFVEFKTTTSPQDPKTTALVKTLRRDLAPALERTGSNQVYVFGQTAVFVDFSKVLAAKMPLFFIAIIGLSFLLLMLAFRSLVIPATAAVMNLFAAGASFGIVVAIFQWGWLSEALGIGAGGPIDAFLPVLFFAILFGLSMDYQVFLVSRMHEEWVHSGDNSRAIRVGQAETGGIITAAAFIMIAVFGGFILGDARAIKLIGMGLGGAIFLDAFILRTVLVPSLMHVLGRANWYFPTWLDRITPQVSVEPAEDGQPEPDNELEPV